MISTLIRQDTALKNKSALYAWLLLSLIVGVILGGAGQKINTDTGIPGLSFALAGESFTYTFMISWILLSLYLGPAEVANHCHRMALPLPLSAKTLWLSRVLALIIAETIIFFTAGLVVGLVNLISGSSPLFPTSILVFLLQQYACVLLLIAVFQSLYIKRMDMPSVFSSYAILILCWGTSGALIAWLAYNPIQYALIPFAAALILFANDKRQIKTPAALSRAKMRWIVWVALFRTLYHPLLSPLAFLGLGVHAIINMDYGLHGKSHFSFAIGVWMFVLLLQFFALLQVHKLNHLPIPRRLIYACQVIPSIATIILFTIIGVIVSGYSANPFLSAGSWTRVLPLTLVYVLLPWFIIQSFMFAARGSSGLRVRLFVLLGLINFGYIFTIVFRFPENFSWRFPDIFNYTIRDLAQKIHLNTPILWISALAILLASYFITERFFKSAQFAQLRR
jgi:hypothetical protein